MTDDTVKGPASYFPSIEKKYGHPILHWQQVAGRPEVASVVKPTPTRISR